MRTTSAALMFFIVAASAVLMAQAPPKPQSSSAPPTPQQMMGYFTGEWKLTGTASISPGSPKAPFRSTERGEFLPGGHFVEIHSVSHGPLGDVHSVRMMEYNSENSTFTYNAYNSLGEHQVALCKVQGDTWVWNADEKMNGIATKGRYTVNLTSPNAYNFKSEVQKPDGSWVTVMEGTATRVPMQRH